VTARPKFTYTRSRKLLQAVADLPCQACGREGYTQAAHSNQSCHGKGRGIKASDVYTAALCDVCHSALDQGSHLTREQRVELWGNAWRKTVKALLSAGTWPADVAIPDIRLMN
jgi:hypothetical protein